jgi:hypothetical protein
MSDHIPGLVQELKKSGGVKLVLNRVIELLLFNASSAIFQLYHGESKLIFSEIMMRSALYWTNTLR